jgi:acetyltransferase-like isoleucine patch superfamily enzyme
MESYNRIAPDVALGEGVRLASFINAYGCRIGDRTKVGSFVEIQKGAAIGADCKISSHTFVCEGVTVEDGVFVGHNVTFTNDRFPRAVNADGSLQTEADWKVVPTLVRRRASIGSSVTLVCGIEIGEGAMVGAGSVVTKSVPAGELWAGNPARFIRNLKPGE